MHLFSFVLKLFPLFVGGPVYCVILIELSAVFRTWNVSLFLFYFLLPLLYPSFLETKRVS